MGNGGGGGGGQISSVCSENRQKRLLVLGRVPVKIDKFPLPRQFLLLSRSRRAPGHI